MATLSPFRGLLFNPERVPHVQQAVAFPPDSFVQKSEAGIISQSPYHVNALLEILQRRVNPTLDDLRKPFEAWKRQHVFVEENVPSLYATEESFTLRGKFFKRTTLYALVSTQAEDALDTVVPHEKTDPLRLERVGTMLKAFQAHISPIFALYEDPRRWIRSALKAVWKHKIRIRHFQFSHNRLAGDLSCSLYRLQPSKEVDRLLHAFKKTPLFIADGHHRYEAALQIGAPWVLMGLTAVEDPGLQVLPIHRLVLISKSDQEGWMRRLKGMFLVSPVVRTSKINHHRENENPKGQIRMLIQGAEHLLRLPNQSGGGVGLLLTLQQLLEGLTVEYTVEPENIAYHVQKGLYTHGFIVPPLKVRDILEVVRSRGVLPVKSTYFFPKLFSGLIMAHTPID